MDDPIESHQLRSIVERIERLEEEKKTIADDIKEVYAEAKGNGYDVKVLRKLIALRKRDADERAEEEAVLDLYEQALGDLADTPLGRAAAPGFASRAPMARSTESYPERVSRTAERQNPSEGEVGSAVRTGAPVSQTTTPGSLTAAQSEAAAGSSPEQGADECTAGDGEAISVQSAQFVTLAGEGEGILDPPIDPSPAAERPKFARKEHVLRPHCQRPEMCGSYGSKHCAECERAAKDADDGDADTIPAFVRKTHDHSAMGEQA